VLLRVLVLLMLRAVHVFLLQNQADLLLLFWHVELLLLLMRALLSEYFSFSLFQRNRQTMYRLNHLKILVSLLLLRRV
jgi:hypothetical protein